MKIKIRDPARRALAEGGVRLLLAKATRQARTRAMIFPASRALRKQIRSASGIERCLDIAFDFRFGNLSLAPQQNRSEIEGLLLLLQQAPPKVVLEIGTASGATIMLFACVSDGEATLVTVDLPLGISRERLVRSAARGPRQTIRALRTDSHAAETKASVQELLGGRPVDFLFIDGDHSYEGVKADFETYAPFVRPGGFIAFHDIVPGPEEYVGGVPAFWQELKQGRATREFVASWQQRGLGIGVIETT